MLICPQAACFEPFSPMKLIRTSEKCCESMFSNCLWTGKEYWWAWTQCIYKELTMSEIRFMMHLWLFVSLLVGWLRHLLYHFYRPCRSWRNVWLSWTWRTQPWSEPPRPSAVLTLSMRTTWMPRLCMTRSCTWKPGSFLSTSSRRGLWISVVIKSEWYSVCQCAVHSLWFYCIIGFRQ